MTDSPTSTPLNAHDAYSRGMDLLREGRPEEALHLFRLAQGLQPDHPQVLLCVAHCLHALGRYDQTLPLYDSLLTREPASVTGWNNRGNALLELGRHGEAAESYRRALQIDPSLHDCRIALATCLQAQGLLREAQACCDAVLEASPSHAEAHWNRSLLLLLQGDYANGWREYEWRWQKRGFSSPRRDFPQPPWKGENLAGRTLLVHAEQGFGDVLQFCRYLPLVAARGAGVIFECHAPLVPLVKSLLGVRQVVPTGSPLPPFDLHVPLMSLPLLFGTTVATIPAQLPYLSPPPHRLPIWRNRVAGDGRLKVGLCWNGKAYPDPLRSCPLELLEPLGEAGNVALYSLQVGWDTQLPPGMVDYTAYLNDFGDTAALISMLDMVITIDTAVAHLAGALGKLTWVMLPHAADWRWLLDRDDSPWYPTMRLFRQNGTGSWQEPTERVMSALRQIEGSASHRQGPAALFA